MSEIRRSLLMQKKRSDVDPTLIFYAPLSKGDLTDNISGAMLNNYSSLVSWSRQEKMYYVVQTLSYTDNPYWNIDLTSALTKTLNQPFTFVVDGRSEVASRYNYPVFFFLGDYSNGEYGIPGITVNGWVETDKTAFKRRALIFDGSTIKTYANGVLTGDSQQDDSSGWRVINWQNQAFQKLCLNPFRHRDGANINIYIKNIRVYNRALTIEEITSLPL